MPDVLATAVRGMAAAILKCRGQTAVYTSGNDRVGIVAARGRLAHEVADEAGLAVTVQRETWVLRATDLAFPDGLRLPAAGDRITTTGAIPQTFEVLPADPRKPPYDFPDPDRVLIRVYTAQVA